MYDIPTLFSVPEGFTSKAIVSTLRAFGDRTNAMPLRQPVSKSSKTDYNPPPRFPSRKASATVALTSTTALRTWKPLPSMPVDSSPREENVIPFPTAPVGEHTITHDPPPGLKRPLPVEARRRRSGALAPPSARTSVTIVVRPVSKRPRKSKRVLADLQFTASVHRSIIALHAEVERRQNVTVDMGVDVMIVEDGPGSRDIVVARVREELRGLDQQLVVRLAQRLRTGGFAPTVMDANPLKDKSHTLPSTVPLEGTRAPPPSPEMIAGADAMDVSPDPLPASPTTLQCAHHLLPAASLPPLPLPPAMLGNSPPPRSPPGLVSPRVPSQVPAEKRIYTMPQLVATHILRFHERGGARTPNYHPHTPRTRSPLCKPLAR
ncbi:hypothetical protein B0F90DRAFT_1670535 [Multifurca ochricompacta]|uniref:Uncharacterized protein n=1 Tax=Multifurca ochricompacta TaxID=376703 RepID=A0AAD4LZW9_9AGAM|nr:hypothetical protein B0F90DRAFT_1670535 [Multifurca ochricompacta]